MADAAGSCFLRAVIVGGGEMGEAVLAGLIAASDDPAASLCPADVVVAEPENARRARLAAVYGVSCVADACSIDRADLVILAVKPQVMPDVLKELAARAPFARPAGAALFVSIAAGFETRSIEEALGCGTRVVRAMPNLPLRIGAGATAVAAGTNAEEADVEAARALFAAFGYACVVDEADMDAVCAVSGSGPAYVAAMIEALSAAGARQGLDVALALDLSLQTVYGTAKLLLETGRSVTEFREAVCSPGGTTLAALEVMRACGFNDAFDAGVAAAVLRAKELAAS